MKNNNQNVRYVEWKRNVTQECWDQLSKIRLTDREVVLYANQLNWHIVSEFGQISQSMWKRFQKKIDIWKIRKNPSITEETYQLIVNNASTNCERKIQKELGKDPLTLSRPSGFR